MARRKWRVVWTEGATNDLVEIVSFVARRSPANARRLLTGLRSKADSLERSRSAAASFRNWHRPAPERGANLWSSHIASCIGSETVSYCWVLLWTVVGI